MAEQNPEIPGDEYQRLVSLAEDFYRQPRQDSKKPSPEVLVTTLMDQAADVLAKSAQQKRRDRQAEGIAQAKRKGVRFGRPPAPTPEDFPELVEAWRRKEITFQQALEKSGLSESTFYRRLRQYRQA